MKQLTHTAGPWHVVTTEDRGSGKIISITSSPNPQAGDSRAIICRILNIVSDRPLDDEDIANAHLIAAAPETAEERDKLKVSHAQLLEALKELLLLSVEQDLSGNDTKTLHLPIWSKVSNAIAKAEKLETNNVS